MQYKPATPAQRVASQVAVMANITDPFGWAGYGPGTLPTQGGCPVGTIGPMRHAITPALAAWLAGSYVRHMLFASAVLGYGGEYGVMPACWWGLPRRLLRAAARASGVYAMP